MAEVVTVASGVVALVAFGIQTSHALYQTIQSFQTFTKNVRDLKAQLGALQGVLHELEQIVGDELPTELNSLKLPLYACGTACKEFNEVVRKCAEHSSGPRPIIRDWAKVRYRGSDVSDFANSLAEYKSIIQIALGGLNLRTSAVTMKCLQEYREMVRNTTADLEERLSRINEKLQTLSAHRLQANEAKEFQRMEAEKNTALKCLDICALVTSYIEQHQKKTVRDGISGIPAGHIQVSVDTDMATRPARQVTASMLDEVQGTVKTATRDLRQHLEFVHNRLSSLSQHSLGNVEEEKATIQQCLDVCEAAANKAQNARVIIFDDVATGHDSKQIIVSTIGDLISAKGVSVGDRSVQIAGQMSDGSLQHVSHTVPQGIVDPLTRTGAGEATLQFEGRHGTGRSLGFQGKSNS